MQIILSTRNPSKAEQIKNIFKDLPLEILTLEEAGIEGEAVEDGNTLEENSFKKAWFAHEAKPDIWTMADDTGFFIQALNGRPGLYAARWAGEDATTEEITQFTLRQLENTTDRSAGFKTCVVLISPGGEKHVFTGNANGHIIHTPRTKPQPKMPYSPIFIPHGYDKTWAEMTVEEENQISHRGKAFRNARKFLEEILNQ